MKHSHLISYLITIKNEVVKRTIFDALNFAVMACIVVFAVMQPSDDQMLKLKYNALLFLGFFVLGALVSAGLNRFPRLKTLGELLFEPPDRKSQEILYGFFESIWGWQLLISFVLTIIAGGYQTHFSLRELFDAQGLSSAGNLFSQMASPDWELLPLAVIKVIETIFIAMMATVFAVPVAFFLAFLSAKNIMKHPALFLLYGILRTFLNVVRSIEPVIWAIIFSVWVGIGSFSGMLALMIHSIASLTKQYSEVVESVSEGPIEGIQSTGANFVQTIWFAIVPQVMLPYISFTIYRWDINVRMATIIGFAGGGGIGTLLNQYSMRAMWPQVGCLIVVIAIVVWVMDMASAYIRESLK